MRASPFSILAAVISLLSMRLAYSDPPIDMSIESERIRDICTPIETYQDFIYKISMAASDESITFCPFEVQKQEDDLNLVLEDSQVQLRCVFNRECIIKGAGNHVLITGPLSSVTFDGFTFIGATDSAIVIDWSSQNTQTIENCKFTENTSPSQGGAIQAGEETNYVIDGCSFFNNRAPAGAAISHAGKMLVVRSSRFKENWAGEAGIVYVATNATAQVSTSAFVRNVLEVNEETTNGVISADKQKDINVWHGEESRHVGNHAECNGVVVRSENRCIEF